MAQARCISCGKVFEFEQVPPGGRFKCPACGRTLMRPGTTAGGTHPPSEAAPPPAPQEIVLGGFKITGHIRQGGMGVVYEGIQLSLGRRVAIKILSSRLAQKPTAAARFKREAEILVALRHPNIVAILDRGEWKNIPYYVMEYVEGPGPDKKPLSVEDLVQQRTLYPEQVRDLGLQIGEALKYAHAHGIVHRDVKPSNVLIDARGAAQVLDFGIAQFKEPAKGSVTRERVGMGTTDYMAPEQSIDAANVDHRADIYSFGVLLYEMLIYDVPRGAFDPPSRQVPGLNPKWDALILRALRTDREQRYPLMEAMLTDLKSIDPASFGVGKGVRQPVVTSTTAPTLVSTTPVPTTAGGTAEVKQDLPSVRKAFYAAEEAFKGQVAALGEALVELQGTALHRDAGIASYLKEAHTLRDRLAKYDEVIHEIKAQADRQAELDKALARNTADQRALDKEIAGQWLALGDRAWDLFVRGRPETDSASELFQAVLDHEATIDALRDQIKRIEQESEKAGFLARMGAGAKKLAIQAQIAAKGMGRQAALEDAGRKVFASGFPESVHDADLDRLVRLGKEREEGKARLVEAATGLQTEREECTSQLRSFGVTQRAQHRVDEITAEAKKVRTRLDEIHAAMGGWAVENESAIPGHDQTVTSLLATARQTRSMRDDLRLKLKMLEAQVGAARAQARK